MKQKRNPSPLLCMGLSHAATTTEGVWCIHLNYIVGSSRKGGAMTWVNAAASPSTPTSFAARNPLDLTIILGNQVVLVDFASVVLIVGQQIGSVLDAIVAIRPACVGRGHIPVFGFVLHAEAVHCKERYGKRGWQQNLVRY